MKNHKLGGACVAIAVLVTMAVAAPAQANARSSTAPAVSTTLAPPPPDPGTSAAVAAIARLGIPLPRAREAIAVQGAVERADLVSKLEAAVGDAYGGVWYVPAAAQLHVGVTSAAAARIAEAVAVRAGLGSSVTEIPVDSSEAELSAVQKDLNRRLAGLFAREEAATQASVEDNTVFVELGSEVPAGERAALEAEALEASVEVIVTSASRPKFGVKSLARCREFEANKAFCDPTIVGGTSLEAKEPKEPICTVGPAVLPPEKGSTETYVLTAGHCVKKEGEEFFSLNKAGTKTEEIGEAVAFLNGNADVAAIKVKNKFWKQAGDIPVVPAIAEWKEKKETEPFEVTGETAPVEKASTCGSGQTSGFKCGTIKKTGVTLSGVEELVEVEGAKTEEGDSGGPWFSGVGEKPVQGTLVGENEANNNPVFQPLQWSFKRLKEVWKLELELLTEANETRVEEEQGKGTTAFTCVKEADGTLRGEHCLSRGSAAEEYTHEEIEVGKTTEVEGTNEKTAQTTFSAYEPLLTATVSGIQTEISCEKETSTGSIKNETAENEKKVKYMRVKGDKIVITFTNCVAKGVLHELGCTIEGGEVKTNELTAETKEATMSVEFKPPAGKSFATFTLLGEKCTLKGAKEVTGTAKAIPERATLRTSTLTTTGMKFGGATASYISAHTLRMSGGGNPISATTTEP